MKPVEALLLWDKTIKEVESALTYLKRLPTERSSGSNSNVSTLDSTLDIAAINLKQALEKIDKLRNPKEPHGFY